MVDTEDFDYSKITNDINNYFDTIVKDNPFFTPQDMPTMQSMMKLYSKAGKAYLSYCKDSLALYADIIKQFSNDKSEIISVNDRRFQDEIWQAHPYYRFVKDKFTLLSKHIDNLVSATDHIQTPQAKRFRFFTNQLVEALSPHNFIHSNPQVLQQTFETNGKNLIDGFNLFLEDFKKGNGAFNIQMTDPAGFELGQTVAQTPGKVIYQNKLMQLIQYTATTATTHEIPLLIVPPWINKYYILDLDKQNSFVNWVINQGISVFIISWANPDSSFAEIDIDDYVNLGPLTAIDVIKKQLAVRQINTLGFCIGGTLLATTLAYLAKTKKLADIASVTYLATLIDFSKPGDIEVFIDEAQIAYIEQMMSKTGYLDGSMVAYSFNLLRSRELVWHYFVNNYLLGKIPMPFNVLYWNTDSTNLPAKMQSTYLRNFYLKNKLAQKNQFSINGHKLNIADIDIPAFFISTIKDHITPWQSTFIGYNLHGGNKKFLLGESGHIVGIINPPSKKKYGYYENNNHNNNPAQWLANAKHYQNSWWPRWSKWLKQHSGDRISSFTIEKGSFPPIEDAPGRYVKVTLADIR